MSAGERIDFKDIRVGDAVERDLEGIKSSMIVHYRNTERICTINMAFLFNRLGSVWTLFDRPKPAVVLPEKLGLGWIAGHGARVLADWYRGREGLEGKPTLVFRVANDITEWTPATAVPTEALDELRKSLAGSFNYAADLTDFFRAIDSRGGGEG